MTTYCTKCQQDKDDSEFWPKMVDLVRTKGWRGTACRECYRKWARERQPRFTDADVPGTTRQCCRCLQAKGEDGFMPSAWRRAKGVWCRDCHRSYYRGRQAVEPGYYSKYARRRVRERTHEVEDIKRSQGCSSCGETHPACLDFHHVDWRTKKATVSQLTCQGGSIERIREEIEKCILLCANCHRKHHYDTGGPRSKKVLQLPIRKNPTMKKTL